MSKLFSDTFFSQVSIYLYVYFCLFFSCTLGLSFFWACGIAERNFRINTHALNTVYMFRTHARTKRRDKLLLAYRYLTRFSQVSCWKWLIHSVSVKCQIFSRSQKAPLSDLIASSQTREEICVFIINMQSQNDLKTNGLYSVGA